MRVAKKIIPFIIVLVFCIVVSTIISSLGEMLISAFIERTKLADTIKVSDLGNNVIYIGLVVGFSCYYWKRPEFTFRKATIWDYLLLSIVIGLIAVVAKVLLIFLSLADIITFDMLTNTMENVKELFYKKV